MPLRRINFDTFTTEASDKNVQGVAKGVFKTLNGFDIGPNYAGNKAINASGSNNLTPRGICRAPLQGALGEQDSDAKFFTDSPRDSKSLVMVHVEGLGNLLAWVNNGNGANMIGEQAGRRGEILSLTQETWGGRAPIVLGAPQPVPLSETGSSGLDSQCPIPPSPPFWAQELIDQEPPDILIVFDTPIGGHHFYCVISTSPDVNPQGALVDPDIYYGLAHVPAEGAACGPQQTRFVIPSGDINGGAGIDWNTPFTWYLQVLLIDLYGPCGVAPSAAVQTINT